MRQGNGRARGTALERGGLADLPAQADVVASLLQDHAVGMDACLIGGKGSGKTAIARRFAAALGYSSKTVYCYADLPARDLLQRRSTDALGSTTWVDAEAVSAAINGELLIVDNIHRLAQGTLAATLGRLLTDRELQLPDGRRLLAREHYDALMESGECSAEELAGLVPIHPAFRVLATAEPPTSWSAAHGAPPPGGAGGGGGPAAASAAWLGSEMLGLFHFHNGPSLTIADHSALLLALSPTDAAPAAAQAAYASASAGDARPARGADVGGQSPPHSTRTASPRAASYARPATRRRLPAGRVTRRWQRGERSPARAVCSPAARPRRWQASWSKWASRRRWRARRTWRVRCPRPCVRQNQMGRRS